MRVRSLALLGATLLGTSAVAATPAGYAVTGSIKGPDGGWDYASVDPVAHRLYLAHGTAVTAVDLATRTVTSALASAARPHEVLPIPGSGLLLETDGGTGTVRLLDAMTGAEKASIKVGENPDAAIWDAKRKRAIVMNAKSGTVMAIDPAKAAIVGTVTLVPGLEFATFDKKGLLYVNNEDNGKIAVIDLDKMVSLGWIELKGCEEPSGMAYAPLADRIVSACSNGVAAVVNPNKRALVELLPIGKGPDAVLGDPARKRLFIPSGGAGTLAVLAEAPGKVSLVGTVQTEISARTGAVDPSDGTVYLPAAQMMPPAQPGARRQAVPGTFHLIVVSAQ